MSRRRRAAFGGFPLRSLLDDGSFAVRAAAATAPAAPPPTAGPELPPEQRPTAKVPPPPPISEAKRVANQLRLLAEDVAAGRADAGAVRGMLESLGREAAA